MRLSVGMPGSWKLPDKGRDAEVRLATLDIFSPPEGDGKDPDRASLLMGGAEYGYPAAVLLVLIGIGCTGHVLETERRLITGASVSGGKRLVTWAGACTSIAK